MSQYPAGTVNELLPVTYDLADFEFIKLDKGGIDVSEGFRFFLFFVY
jgi:hypothetical protein